MKQAPPSLLPLLRSETQGRLLEAVLAHPQWEWKVSELAEHVRVSPATAMREVDRAEAAGIVRSRRLGNTRLVAVDPTSPFVEPLRRLLVPTFGVPRVLWEEFHDVEGIEALHVVGSWAAAWHGQEGRVQDIDVLAVGDDLDRRALYDAADRAERRLGLPVDVAVRSSSRWHARSDEDDPWLADIRGRPTVPVIE